MIFKELTKLYAMHACKVYNDNLKLLIKYCGYRENNIPQLDTISNFLKSKSPFRQFQIPPHYYPLELKPSMSIIISIRV